MIKYLCVIFMVPCLAHAQTPLNAGEQTHANQLIGSTVSMLIANAAHAAALYEIEVENSNKIKDELNQLKQELDKLKQNSNCK